jgi:ketosteroid isomerase-like protein
MKRPPMMTRTGMFQTNVAAAGRALAALWLVAVGCAPNSARVSDAERRAIADTLETMVRRAYDLSGPSSATVDRLLSLYPDSGRVVSASGGRMVTSRDSLAQGIGYFWESMGQNMRSPRWIWERMVTDVLSSESAVVTATYRVPHRTPRDEPHELAGAMTLVFAKRGDRWVVVHEHLSDRPMPAADMSPVPAPGG